MEQDRFSANCSVICGPLVLDVLSGEVVEAEARPWFLVRRSMQNSWSCPFASKPCRLVVLAAVAKERNRNLSGDCLGVDHLLAVLEEDSVAVNLW